MVAAVGIQFDADSVSIKDREGIILDHLDRARALAIEALINPARDSPVSGRSRTITVTMWDERGVVDADSVTRIGLLAEDAAVGRAILAMWGNRRLSG